MVKVSHAPLGYGGGSDDSTHILAFSRFKSWNRQQCVHRVDSLSCQQRLLVDIPLGSVYKPHPLIKKQLLTASAIACMCMTHMFTSLWQTTLLNNTYLDSLSFFTCYLWILFLHVFISLLHMCVYLWLCVFVHWGYARVYLLTGLMPEWFFQRGYVRLGFFYWWGFYPSVGPLITLAPHGVHNFLSYTIACIVLRHDIPTSIVVMVVRMALPQTIHEEQNNNNNKLYLYTLSIEETLFNGVYGVH